MKVKYIEENIIYVKDSEIDEIEANFIIIDNCKINKVKCCYCEIKNDSYINELYFINNVKSNVIYVSPLTNYNNINNPYNDYLICKLNNKVKLNNFIISIDSTINEIFGNDTLYGYLNKTLIVNINTDYKLNKINSYIFGDKYDNV